MLDKAAIRAANEYLRLNYPGKPVDKVLRRPNHGLGHSVRKTLYLRHVIQYFANFAKDQEFKKHCSELLANKDRLEKLSIVLLFSVTGREGEESAVESLELYSRYKENSMNNAKKYLKQRYPYITEAEVDELVQTIKYMGGVSLDADGYRDSAISDGLRRNQYLLGFAHNLDLIRCHDKEKFARDLADFIPLVDESKSGQADFLGRLQHAAFHSIEKTGSSFKTVVATQDGGAIALVRGEKAYNKRLYALYNPNRRLDDQSFALWQTVDADICQTMVAETQVPEFRASTSFSGRTLYKAIRADERDFWADFSYSFVYGNKSDLRFGARTGYTIRLEERPGAAIDYYSSSVINDRARYTPREKANYTTAQSVTFANLDDGYMPEPFGWFRRDILVGISVPSATAIIQRIITHDYGTSDRTYDSFSKSHSAAKLRKLVPATFKTTLDELTESDQIHHNEVMARLTCIHDGSLNVIVIIDNIESRLLAISRACDLQSLIEERDAKKHAPVPVVFYQRPPKTYTMAEQRNDVIKAKPELKALLMLQLDGKKPDVKHQKYILASLKTLSPATGKKYFTLLTEDEILKVLRLAYAENLNRYLTYIEPGKIDSKKLGEVLKEKFTNLNWEKFLPRLSADQITMYIQIVQTENLMPAVIHPPMLKTILSKLNGRQADALFAALPEITKAEFSTIARLNYMLGDTNTTKAHHLITNLQAKLKLESANDIKDLFEKLAPRVKNVLFAELRDKFPSLIKNLTDYLTIYEAMADTDREEFLQIFGEPQKFLKSADQVIEFISDPHYKPKMMSVVGYEHCLKLLPLEPKQFVMQYEHLSQHEIKMMLATFPHYFKKFATDELMAYLIFIAKTNDESIIVKFIKHNRDYLKHKVTTIKELQELLASIGRGNSVAERNLINLFKPSFETMVESNEDIHWAYPKLESGSEKHSFFKMIRPAVYEGLTSCNDVESLIHLMYFSPGVTREECCDEYGGTYYMKYSLPKSVDCDSAVQLFTSCRALLVDTKINFKQLIKLTDHVPGEAADIVFQIAIETMDDDFIDFNDLSSRHFNYFNCPPATRSLFVKKIFDFMKVKISSLEELKIFIEKWEIFNCTDSDGYLFAVINDYMLKAEKNGITALAEIADKISNKALRQQVITAHSALLYSCLELGCDTLLKILRNMDVGFQQEFIEANIGKIPPLISNSADLIYVLSNIKTDCFDDHFILFMEHIKAITNINYVVKLVEAMPYSKRDEFINRELTELLQRVSPDVSSEEKLAGLIKLLNLYAVDHLPLMKKVIDNALKREDLFNLLQMLHTGIYSSNNFEEILIHLVNRILLEHLDSPIIIADMFLILNEASKRSDVTAENLTQLRTSLLSSTRNMVGSLESKQFNIILYNCTSDEIIDLMLMPAFDNNILDNRIKTLLVLLRENKVKALQLAPLFIKDFSDLVKIIRDDGKFSSTLFQLICMCAHVIPESLPSNLCFPENATRFLHLARNKHCAPGGPQLPPIALADYADSVLADYAKKLPDMSHKTNLHPLDMNFREYISYLLLNYNKFDKSKDRLENLLNYIYSYIYTTQPGQERFFLSDPIDELLQVVYKIEQHRCALLKGKIEHPDYLDCAEPKTERRPKFSLCGSSCSP